MTNVVLYETVNQVVIITLNRPERLNAISAQLREDLYNAVIRFESDDNSRVAILTGAGDKAFCAGMDLKESAEKKIGLRTDGVPGLNEIKRAKPLIAAVNGFALAGGWMLAQSCDLCVASEHAQFGITEGKMGRGMPWAVPIARMMSQRHAMELLLTGRMISAQRAYEIGFVNEVVPHGRLMDAAMSLANEIAACAPLTVVAAREMIYTCQEMGVSAAMKVAAHLFDRVYRSSDALEGPRAFAEKRKPNWKGM